ncbi:MAG: hypothetical protein BAA01_00365 [Bacillus thermozeamaize]|uniref:Uncharacterized protein n=1 Tax=Bacillus thermozeamaize TaxID=230954 RepID=A0A1Y3Q303_9BACI|nr:MAG: hypothetical protein BAA01_00365 [Bacillus thermozeamaize]
MRHSVRIQEQKYVGMRDLSRQMESIRREMTKIRRGMQMMQDMQGQLENALIEIQDLKGMFEGKGGSNPEYLPAPRQPGSGSLPPAPQQPNHPLGALGGIGNLLQNVDIGEIMKLLNNPLIQDLMRNFLKR